MSPTMTAERPTAAPPSPQPSTSPAPVSRSPAPKRQPTWQRIILLLVLGYEVLGCFSGGALLVLAPDGHLMDMDVEGMRGFFPDFFVPGLLLIGLGIVNLAAFVAVWRRTRTDWLFSGLALGGLTVWFLVEIAVVGTHWLQAMWGLPVLLGVVMALPLIPSRAEGRSFIQSHPVLIYYIVTFAISWGGFFLVTAGRTGILATAEEAASLLPAVFVVTFVGPTVAGLLLTGLDDGRAAYRDLLVRLPHWRVRARWYAVALLTGPLLATAPLLALVPTSRVFLPGLLDTSDRVSLVLVSLATGLAVTVFEELGWTGFATPRLRAGHGVFATGLVMGFMWGVWHTPSQVWASGDASGALASSLLAAQLVFAFAVLAPFRMLMVWVYEHTQSLLVAMLMHGGLVAALLALRPVGLVGETMLIWYLAVAVATWVVLAAVALATGGYVSRQRLRTRVA